MLVVFLMCLLYLALMIFVTIEMPADLWVRILLDMVLVLVIFLFIGLLMSQLRVRFYWLHDGMQLERRNIELLREPLA